MIQKNLEKACGGIAPRRRQKLAGTPPPSLLVRPEIDQEEKPRIRKRSSPPKKNEFRSTSGR
jgi:hypothetical protein